ncbi:MAG: guanylate kinase [Pseudomonadota bacterium]
MFILASPSGAGKSTLSRLLMQSELNLHLSISATTRARRPSEVDGVHYHFVTPQRFQSMINEGELLEWAEVHGNRYGTPREPIEKALSEGRDVLFDIDWQGTLQIYKHARPDVASVFLLPPSIPELKSRLERRAEDSAEIVARRMASAKTEIGTWENFDYVLINDDLDTTFVALRSILHAERLKRERQKGLGEFAVQLQAAL